MQSLNPPAISGTTSGKFKNGDGHDLINRKLAFEAIKGPGMARHCC